MVSGLVGKEKSGQVMKIIRIVEKMCECEQNSGDARRDTIYSVRFLI